MARTIVCTCLLLCALLASAFAAGAGEGVSDEALRGAWRPALAGEDVSAAAGDETGWRTFSPELLTSHGAAAHGNWVLLWADNGWPAPPWVLEVGRPGRQDVTFFPPAGGPPQRGNLLRGDQGWPAHGRLAFMVDPVPGAGEPLRLHVDASQVTPAAMSYRIRPVAGYLAADARWLAFATACLSVMTTMAAMALLFGLWLRDSTFLAYVVYVMAYALILAGQSGYILNPLDWEWLAASVGAWARPVTAVTVVFAVIFLDRFADLARFLPRARMVLWGLAAATTGLSVAGSLPGMAGWSRGLINPLLILGGPLLMAMAAWSAWRGSRYATFFLIGWSPLLTVTVLGSLQLYGFFPGWAWVADAALAAGAFEAVVLSLGLAERNSLLRQERDRARVLADLDGLTGLLNRRAWNERMLPLDERVRQGKGGPLVLLFLDLDHFKQVNDRFGHATGDAALRLLADVLRRTVRRDEFIGRYGGEEFVVALPGTDGLHALEVAERIRNEFRESAATLAEGLSVSIGLAHLQAGEDVARVLERADAALYSAKAAGRDQVVLAD